MSKFEDEMYKFIVDENNFDLALEISNLMPDIQDKLVEKFWNLVEVKLEEMDSEDNWIFKFEGNYVDIIPNAVHSYSFSFVEVYTKPWIAFWINEKGDKNKALEILEELGVKDDLKIAKRDTAAVYRNYPNDVSSDYFFKSIIPSRRTEKVNEVSSWIWNFIEEHELALNRLNSNG